MSISRISLTKRTTFDCPVIPVLQDMQDSLRESGPGQPRHVSTYTPPQPMIARRLIGPFEPEEREVLIVRKIAASKVTRFVPGNADEDGDGRSVGSFDNRLSRAPRFRRSTGGDIGLCSHLITNRPAIQHLKHGVSQCLDMLRPDDLFVFQIFEEDHLHM